jgi:hypothetical protein
MVVRTHANGRSVEGIYVGPRNARRKFPRKAPAIELHLGHLRIHCDLPPEFWRGQPVIRDQRLSDWLESRFFHGRARRTPLLLAMVPAGNNAFRLLPLPPPMRTAKSSAAASARKPAVLAPGGPPPAALYRRPANAAAPVRSPESPA